MFSRVGVRISAGAPYDLHCSPAWVSFCGSHFSATAWDSWFMGTLSQSPFAGVTMRQRQSSVTSATQ